jgi:hypothetical protein
MIPRLDVAVKLIPTQCAVTVDAVEEEEISAKG